MKLIIEIELAGAAIEQDSDTEVADILRRLAGRIADDSVGIEAVNCTHLLDANGNSVGEVYLSDEEVSQ